MSDNQLPLEDSLLSSDRSSELNQNQSLNQDNIQNFETTPEPNSETNKEIIVITNTPIVQEPSVTEERREQIFNMPSQLADSFTEQQKEIASKMKYSNLTKTNKSTVASLSSKLYKTTAELYLSVLKCQDGLLNASTNESKLSTITNSLKTLVDAYKNVLTESSDIETLKNFLTNKEYKEEEEEAESKADEEERSSDSESDTKTIPIADFKCRLEKGTPIFSGKPTEIIKNWLIIIKNAFATNRIDKKNQISCVLAVVRDTALEVTINYIAKNGYSSWENYEKQ